MWIFNLRRVPFYCSLINRFVLFLLVILENRACSSVIWRLKENISGSFCLFISRLYELNTTMNLDENQFKISCIIRVAIVCYAKYVFFFDLLYYMDWCVCLSSLYSNITSRSYFLSLFLSLFMSLTLIHFSYVSQRDIRPTAFARRQMLHNEITSMCVCVYCGSRAAKKSKGRNSNSEQDYL